MAKFNSTHDVLLGASAVSVVIGVALVGLAFGQSLSTGVAMMTHHPLFDAGMGCLGGGVVLVLALSGLGGKTGR